MQNSETSCAGIDFTAALARLLNDASLRAEFRADPEFVLADLGVRAADRKAVAALRAEELEVQALILIRKRLEKIRHLIPFTCFRLGIALGRKFEQYGLTQKLSRNQPELRDALAFWLHLAGSGADSPPKSELNRLRFALADGQLSIHFVSDLYVRGHQRRGVQLLMRVGRSRWREWVIYLSGGESHPVGHN